MLTPPLKVPNHYNPATDSRCSGSERVCAEHEEPERKARRESTRKPTVVVRRCCKHRDQTVAVVRSLEEGRALAAVLNKQVGREVLFYAVRGRDL